MIIRLKKRLPAYYATPKTPDVCLNPSLNWRVAAVAQLTTTPHAINVGYNQGYPKAHGID
jgi:hypothetical protein